MTQPPWIQLVSTLGWILLGLAALALATYLVRRRRAGLPAAPVAPLSGSAEHLSWLQVEAEEGTRLVEAAGIDWIEAAGNCVRIHHGGAAHLFRASLSSVEEALDPQRFVRIHRSTIVNLGSLAEVHPWGSGDSMIRLRDGTELRLSRSYSAVFEERVARRL